MPVVTANDLKTKGVSDIERLLQDAQEVVISVRGKPRYVVMDIAHYGFLRKCEIMAAWAQTRDDLAAGRYRRESADSPMETLAPALVQDFRALTGPVEQQTQLVQHISPNEDLICRVVAYNLDAGQG